MTGQFLIAMPGMGDPRFAGAVVLICEHSPEGAMGLIINKPIPEIRFAEMLDQLEIASDLAPDLPVLFGGPVESGRGFVLHSPDYTSGDGGLSLDIGVSMSASLEVLEDIAHGGGPARAMMALGYAGWGPGQLEGELRANGWLTCAADAALVFDTDWDGKWEAALKRLGISPLMLSHEGGRA